MKNVTQVFSDKALTKRIGRVSEQKDGSFKGYYKGRVVSIVGKRDVSERDIADKHGADVWVGEPVHMDV